MSSLVSISPQSHQVTSRCIWSLFKSGHTVLFQKREDRRATLEECEFKRLKSLAQLAHVPKHDDRSSSAWLYGKLRVISRTNSRNSKYEPTVFSGCAGDSAGKRRNRARPCFQLLALVEERLGDLSAKRQTRSVRDIRD